MSSTSPGPDGRPRCAWCLSTPEYLAYHDTEWGFPVADDRRLFEKLCLEGFQSGLSWRTILAKRENFRSAFCHFDIQKIARFTAADVERLAQDAGIVRHRGKIASVINNAARALELAREENSLAAYIWRYAPAPAPTATPPAPAHGAVPPVTMSAESIALSKDLKRRGWSFVGPTTVYAFMQAMGLVNDHAADCAIRTDAAKAAARFRRP